jgi:hypothetical protein
MFCCPRRDVGKLRKEDFVGKMNRIAIDITRAITPPNLLGIDLGLRRRIGNITLVEYVLV